MNAKIKGQVASGLVRRILPRLLNDKDSFNRVLGAAVQLQLAQIMDDAFRQRLDDYYADMDLERAKENLDYESKRQRLLAQAVTRLM